MLQQIPLIVWSFHDFTKNTVIRRKHRIRVPFELTPSSHPDPSVTISIENITVDPNIDNELLEVIMEYLTAIKNNDEEAEKSFVTSRHTNLDHLLHSDHFHQSPQRQALLRFAPPQAAAFQIDAVSFADGVQQETRHLFRPLIHIRQIDPVIGPLQIAPHAAGPFLQEIRHIH